MREKLKEIGAYIFRRWEERPGYPHPGLRILPPFLLEALAYLIGLSTLYLVRAYLWAII